MNRVELSIDGMGCGGRVKNVGGLLSAIQGVIVEDVQIGRATISIDPGRAAVDQVAKKLEDAGYTVVGTHADQR